MSKNKIIISSLLLASSMFAPIAFAQDYVIPTPTCVDTPEIPCPGRGKSYERALKPSLAPITNVPTGFSKLYEYLSSLATKIGNTADYTREGLKNWFRGIYDGLLHRFGKVE